MRRKGFTLIEVLATIIVLAIVALIAVPLVLDSIEKARKGAFKDSVYQAFQEVQYYLVKNNLEEIPEEGIDVKDIEFKNNIFISGRLVLNESGNIQASNIGDGRYCAIGEKDALKIYDGECDLSVPTCELNTKEMVGMNGWYGENPLVIMHTMPVKSGFLTYGIGIHENYNYTVNGIGKVGEAKYQTIGDKPVTVYCYVKNVNDVKGSNEINIQIDKTEPTSSNFSYSIAGKNLTLVATGIDNESGISMYQFSIDGGTTWTEVQASNTYTYRNLQPIIYDVRVRVYNGTYVASKKENNLHKDSEVKRVSMAELEAPTYSYTPTGWTSSNVDITVHFNKDGAYLIKPSITVVSNINAITCSQVYNGTYTCDGSVTKTLQGGVWYRVDSNPTLAFTGNGSIIAQVADGINYKSASTFNISNIDKSAPSVPIVIYNGGSNSCTWKNNYNITLTSTDVGSGIAYYEIDWDSDGVANTTTGSNFIPGNGWSACATRFRAVDTVGNRSGWTEGHHIHMDTEKPNISASVSGKVATLTMSDNIGLGGWAVTTSTSTPSSWDSGSSSVTWTASNAGTYYAHVIDHAGNTNYTSFSIAQSAFSYAAKVVPDGVSYAATRPTTSQTCGTSYTQATREEKSKEESAYCSKPGGLCNGGRTDAYCVPWGSTCIYGGNPDFTQGYDGACACGEWVKEYKCPSGYTEESGKCYGPYKCSNGTEPTNGQCSSYSCSCPYGYTYEFGTCYGSYTCNSGDRLDNNTKTCYATGYICDRGGELSADGRTCVFS